MALHRAWQTAAERLYREFQWPSARRVAERDAVQLARPCPSSPAEWRLDYNTIRPHSAWAICRQPITPSSAPRHRNGTGRCAQSGAPRPAPLPHRAQQAQMTNRLYLSLDENRGSGHAGLPKDGLLFPDIPPDRLGRRAGTATKRLGKWVRQKVGI